LGRLTVNFAFKVPICGGREYLSFMKREKFSAEGAIVWSAILPHHRELVLRNVFCVKCGGITEMVNFSGKMKKGDLVLTGSCAKCGGKVLRILESSEQNPLRN
jgi:hypothetical protein